MIARNAALGFALGAVWGAAARLWMRLINTGVPEFTWGGTLGIILISAVGGLGVGLVRAARLTRRRRWWRAFSLLALPLVIAPQGIFAFLPAFLLAGLGLSGRLPRWTAAIVVTLAAVIPPVVLYALTSPVDRIGFPYPTGILGLWILQFGLAIGGAELFRRWPGSERQGPVPPEKALVHL